MARVYSEQSFPSTYKDDFKDSDNYHRILFNSGRALQARELTQMQTIIQEEIARFGRNIFKDGASVNPGGPTVFNRYEFIKLNTSTNSLPTDFETIVGNEFTGQSSGVKVRILEVVAATDTDPATLYVEYTGSSAAVSGSIPIRMSAGEDITDGSETLTVQTTNTVANPCVGQGTTFSNSGGDFFVRGHFVFANPQTIIIDKYGTSPTKTLGFTVTEDIVTVDDDDALYDNQGATPNRSSPGADRYRIRLILTTEDLITDENFVFYAKVKNGEIIEQVTGTESYNKINDEMATRTKEESGDYIVKPFDIDFSTDSEGDTLDAIISAGNAYVDGYRANRNDSYDLSISKPRTSQTIKNEVVGINYGNYFTCNTLEGDLGITTFAEQNLSTSASNPSGSVIGKARVRYVEEDGANFRVYLFNIKMNSGQVLRDVQTIGTGSNDFAKILRQGATPKSVIQNSLSDMLVFNLPRSRPKTITDIDFEVQRMVTATIGNASTTATPAALTVSGETYTNTGQWIVTRNDTGAVVSTTSISGSGTTSVTLNFDASVAASGAVPITVYAKINKSSPSIRVKQLITDATVTGTMKTVGTETFLSLGKADIKEVKEIRKTNSSGRIVTDQFFVDNGQRPNYYGPGRVLRSNNSSLSGTIYVKFDYFAHNSGDVFAVNSYSGQVDYSQIPAVPTFGRNTMPLRDAIDFRPSTPDSDLDFSATGAVINELPTNGDIFQGDVEYYLPRADKIVLKKNADILHIVGEPGFSRPMPPTPEGTLPLFELMHNAYGLHEDDLGLRILKYKRFTMKDINRLEERIDNLKEQVSLTFLEQDADTMTVLDEDGLARTKSGIFADSFKDTSFRDALDYNNTSNIRMASKVMVPPVSMDAVDLVFDASKSTNVVRKGDNIYLTYTETEAVRQNKISGTENVNPFAVISGSGEIKLSPKSDWWLDTKYAANNVINNTVEQDMGTINGGTTDYGRRQQPTRPVNFTPPSEEERRTGGNGGGQRDPNPFGIGIPQEDIIGGEAGIGQNAFGGVADVNEWSWFGININNPLSFQDEDAVYEGTVRQGRKTTTTFSKRSVVGSFVTTKVIGNRRVDLAFLPFMRSRKIFFKAEGLRPETRYFPFFNGTKVDDWVREESFEVMANSKVSYGRKYKRSTQHPEGKSNLISDTNGVIEGSFFLPCNKNTLRFKAGTREFKLLDIDINQNGASLSRAITQYTSQGRIETRVRDVLSTRTNQVQTRRWQEVTWSDPLAQSFKVPAGDGIFITKVQTYFKTKDSKIQVQCQIREMVNGHPSSDSFMANKFLSPNDVAIPSSQTQAAVLAAPTTFTFDEPVFLKANTEYCIVLLADSVKYNAYVGETYAFELGSTEKRIDRQPSMGSLFKSQNGTTWEPDQTKDMAFKLFKAQFSTAGGKVIMENGDLDEEPLINNPFIITNTSGTIYCRHPNHGFHVGDDVIISGATGGNGLAAANINGTRTCVTVDGFGFTFLAGNSDTATSDSRIGGSNVLATQQVEFDGVMPQFETLVPASTSIVPRGKFTTGKSFAAVSGTQTRYIKDGTFNGDYEEGALNRFNAPRLIANSANETAELGAGERSTSWELSLDTNNADVSPYVDMQRAGLSLYNNRIDRQASVAANGYNAPYSYVTETDPRDGSSLAKHITVPVTLENDGVGIKVMVACNRPADANFELYYRTGNEGDDIHALPWISAGDAQGVSTDLVGDTTLESPIPPDSRNFREYRFLIGGITGTLDEFLTYQLKIVMTSTNSSSIPIFKDLRAIILAN